MDLSPFLPRAVLFDAVGTLLEPVPSVAAAYAAAGRRHGIDLEEAEVRRRFHRAMARQDEIDLRQGGRTSLPREIARWRGIVADVFAETTPAADAGVSESSANAAGLAADSGDVAAHAPTEPIFAELWEHFAAPANWRLFDDAAEAWRALATAGMRLGIASNFDNRLDGICRALQPLDTCRHVFVSSRVGWRKPQPEFFAAIAASLDLAPQEMLLVGDDRENDYAAARAAGWQAALVDRSARAGDDAVQQKGSRNLLPQSGPAGAEHKRFLEPFHSLTELAAMLLRP